MTNHNDWIEQLRFQMEHYEEKAPEGLWRDIQDALPQEGRQARRALVVPLRRWAAAAGIAAALLGGAALYWYRDVPNPNNLTEASEPVGVVQMHAPADPELTEKLNEPSQRFVAQAQPVASTLPVRQSLSGGSVAPKTETDLLPTAPKSTEQVQDPVSPSALPVERQESGVELTAKEQSASMRTEQEGKEPSSRQQTNQIPQKTEQEILRALGQDDGLKRKTNNHLGVDLYASNDLIGIKNSSTVVNYAMTSSFSGFDSDAETPSKASLANYNESSKHYQPYSIGLTGRWAISERWSFSTGLVYTRLRSDFSKTMGGASIKQKQTLHDIGIPLNAMFRVWGNRYFSVYAVAGGQADFNVKATMETEGVSETIDNDRVQWSVNAGIGAQYNFIPSLGIYLEPGVKYYFDNGSSLENTFKDKQVNFNIQFGFRYNIGE